MDVRRVCEQSVMGHLESDCHFFISFGFITLLNPLHLSGFIVDLVMFRLPHCMDWLTSLPHRFSTLQQRNRQMRPQHIKVETAHRPHFKKPNQTLELRCSGFLLLRLLLLLPLCWNASKSNVRKRGCLNAQSMLQTLLMFQQKEGTPSWRDRTAVAVGVQTQCLVRT